MPSWQTIGQLFVRLQNSYGHKFASLFPDDESKALAMADWRHQLAGITDQEVERGFNQLGGRSLDKRYWPPGSFEFRDLCRPPRQPHERPEFQGRALPVATARPKVAQRYIDGLRRRVNTQADC